MSVSRPENPQIFRLAQFSSHALKSRLADFQRLTRMKDALADFIRS